MNASLLEKMMDGVKPLERIERAGRASLAAQRGVTLIEVIIVVTILAMVAGGVAVYAIPRMNQAQVDQAGTDARTIRQAAMQWQVTNAGADCPSISQLKQEKFLDPDTDGNDPWGQAYVLNCSDGSISVSSAGPDKKKGSPDDIQVPKGAASDDEGG